MTGASVLFVAFGLVVVLLSQIVWRPVWRRAVLLAASLFFVWQCAEGQSLLPLIGFVGLGFAGLKLVESGRLKSATPIVVIVLLFFVWLKRYAFLPPSLLLHSTYAALGLSYILFRVIHLLEDAKDNALPGPVSLASYATYTLNFTSFVAGPIQRYQEFEESWQEGRRPSIRKVGTAVERIVTGFFKANVMALLFSKVQADSLGRIAATSTWGTNVVACAIVIASYAFFLYFNFSGYIDIVIGIARLLGIALPENFNRPFSADSFIGFWSRWHITLSNWLKTYVYNPLLLLLMRRYPAASLAPVWGVSAYFVTFFLVGAWHGQTSSFLFFGVLQGLGVSVNKLYEIVMIARLGRKRAKAVTTNPVYCAVCRGLTFTWFAFTLLWFWSNWTQLGGLATAMGPSAILAALFLILVVATLGLASWEAVRTRALRLAWHDEAVFDSRYVRTAWCTVLVLISIVTQLVLRQHGPEIVYKTF
jgi:D-alanyl-lipoteichoic acid acyltransferase DltB (MBOAT superfamily)